MQAGGHEFESHHLHEGNEEDNASRKSGTSECACTDELVTDLRVGYSKNARDERCAKHMRI